MRSSVTVPTAIEALRLQTTGILSVRTWPAALLCSCLIPALGIAQSGSSISAPTAANVAASSEIISWTTGTPSDSQVEFGLTTSYGSVTVRNTVPVTSHSMVLAELSASTIYHYRVLSGDSSGNLSVSSDATFTTPAAGPGTTYYVDQMNCSDSFAGSAAQPWCTLGRASRTLIAGDTVFVRPGIYHESITPPSGSSSAYITYQGLPGAVLDGNGTSVNGQAFNIGTQAYLIISGFEVRNYLNPRPAGNSINVYGTAHDIELTNLTVHDNWNGIIMSNDAHNIVINDCLVYNSRYGVGLENTVHDVFITRVTSHSNKETYIGPVSSYGNGDGFSVDSGTSHLFIRESEAYDNLDGGFDIKAALFECTSCVSRQNTKYGFRLWGDGGPYTLANSVAYGNGLAALQPQATAQNTFFYNSTFAAKTGDEGYIMEGPLLTVTMRNCILFGFAQQVVSGGYTILDEDYNLYYSQQGSPGFTLGLHSQIADPMFVSSASNNYHLQAASPAIDAGLTVPLVVADLDGVLRPQGSGYDIGAYEFSVTRPNPPTGLHITSVQ